MKLDAKKRQNAQQALHFIAFSQFILYTGHWKYGRNMTMLDFDRALKQLHENGLISVHNF